MGFCFFSKGFKKLGENCNGIQLSCCSLRCFMPHSQSVYRQKCETRKSFPAQLKWRQSGPFPQRSMSTLKGGCIAEKEKLGHSTSISVLGCHLSDSVGRYWFDFFFPPPLSTGTKSLLDAEGREERGSENNL